MRWSNCKLRIKSSTENVVGLGPFLLKSFSGYPSSGGTTILKQFSKYCELQNRKLTLTAFPIDADHCYYDIGRQWIGERFITFVRRLEPCLIQLPQTLGWPEDVYSQTGISTGETHPLLYTVNDTPKGNKRGKWQPYTCKIATPTKVGVW